jgi:hypothetical protein
MDGACALTIYPLAVVDEAAVFCAVANGQEASRQRRASCNRNFIRLSLMGRWKAYERVEPRTSTGESLRLRESLYTHHESGENPSSFALEFPGVE